jgi:hypothetical protein
MRLPQPSGPENDDEDDHTSDEHRDDENEAKNLLLQRCHASFGIRGKLRNATKDSVIASRNTNTQATATNAMRALEADVVRLKIVILCRLDGGIDRLGFTCIALDTMSGKFGVK